MRQWRHSFAGLLLLFVFLVPVGASAQSGSTIFSPIIPEECKCESVEVEGGGTSVSAPNWGCVLKVVQNVINTAVALSIVIVVLALVYAGFVFMTSGPNPGARTQAKNVILNSLVGLLILLGAWILVDFVMKAVYDPTAIATGTTQFGPWNSIWAPGPDDMCLVVRQPTPIASGVVGIIRDIATGEGPRIGTPQSPCAEGNTACSVSVLQSLGFSNIQAQAMSCIAMTESTGRPGARTRDSQSSACGTFQITGTNWRNLNLSPNCRSFNSCTNAQCNLEAARALFNESGYQPWTGRCMNRNGCNDTTRYGEYWNPNAVACVRKYDPTGRI